MTKLLASRIAGLKLTGIVTVLLVPMLVLSVLMMNSLREDIALAERQLVGVELNRFVMPVATAAARGTLSVEQTEVFRKQASALVNELGVRPKFGTALADLITYSRDSRFAVPALMKLQVDVAVASNIVLSASPEAYFAGMLVSQQGPDLLAAHTELWTLATRAARDGSLSQQETGQLLVAAGRWKEAQQRAVQTLGNAARHSSDPARYADMLTAAKSMQQHGDQLVRLLARSDPADAATGIGSQGSLGAAWPRLIDDIEAVWAFSARTYEAQVVARLDALRLKLYAALAIAAAACLVGVGGAALLFKSTLRQLDGVTIARDQAEQARAAALQAADDVKRINEDMARLNADLARNLAMLREAQDENLRRGKMAQLGQLTATVAHELRNPLGAVRTSAFLLARKVKDKGLGIEPQIERINNGITRCDNIISQLLDFARSKAIQPEQVDFDDWLARLIEEEAANLPPALAIECHLGMGGSAAIDPARMSRAIGNLLSNASEALVGKGEETGKSIVSNPTIVISSAITARGFEVSVADNGPGIAPEHLDKILEPLFTTKNFGTGLGLPAVQKIMEQHGGGLDIASEPGRGARFTLWWPGESKMKEAS